jgi:hypothetical protein
VATLPEEPAGNSSTSPNPKDTRSALLHPEDFRARLLSPFYELLNAHPQCAVDLDIVLTQYRLFCPRDETRRWLPLAHHLHIWPLVQWFMARWHLPQDHGVDDLDWTLHLALYHNHRPRLDIGARGGMVPTVGHSADELRERGVEPPSDGADRWPLICPPRLDPIRYDPARLVGWDSPATIRRIAREYAQRVEQHILDQAQGFDAAAQAAGYRALPAHFRTPEQRRRAAHRLYRYVIEGAAWETIADGEAGRRGENYAPGADTVRRTATRLARSLTIPLEPRGLGSARPES